MVSIGLYGQTPEWRVLMSLLEGSAPTRERRVCKRGDEAHVKEWRDSFSPCPTDQVPFLIVVYRKYNEYICAVDVGHGHDLLWDGRRWHMSPQGIFLPNVVLLSDYHGYPEGALFVKA